MYTLQSSQAKLVDGDLRTVLKNYLQKLWSWIFFVPHNYLFLHYFRSMSGNKIEYLPDKSFSGNKKLTILRLKNNPIMSVGLKAFANLPRLENL